MLVVVFMSLLSMCLHLFACRPLRWAPTILCITFSQNLVALFHKNFWYLPLCPLALFSSLKTNTQANMHKANTFATKFGTPLDVFAKCSTGLCISTIVLVKHGVSMPCLLNFTDNSNMKESSNEDGIGRCSLLMQLFCPPPISIIRIPILILCLSDDCSFQQCAYLCPVLLLQISDYCPTDRFEKVAI